MGFAGRDVHIDVPLSNIAIAYKPEGFIADQIFPIVPVGKQSDGYYVWDLADVYRREETLRAPGTQANIISRSVASGTFYCKNYALKDRIPYEDLANADAGFIFTERQNRAEFIKERLYIDWEYRLVNNVTSGSNVGSYSAVASGWGGSGADPIDDLNTCINNVQDSTGQKPNSIIFGMAAWRLFRENAAVLNKFYGTAGASATGRLVTKEMVAGLFELERILVGGAYRNTGEEGQAATLSQMWGENVLVYYAPTTPRKDKPSLGYSFRWNGVQGMSMQAEVFQDEKAKAEEVQLGYFQEEKITAKALGFLLTAVSSNGSGI